MPDTDFNGWSNQATWAVGNWIDNTEEIQGWFLAAAKLQWQTLQWAPAVLGLADWVKGIVDGRLELNHDRVPGPLDGLMQAGAEQVDYRDIARWLIEKVEEGVR